MHPLLSDPWIAAHVEAAVAPYVGRLSAGEIAWMREQLAETIAGDERAQRLARRARSVVVNESGEVRRDIGGTVTPIDAARHRKNKAG